MKTKLNVLLNPLNTVLGPKNIQSNIFFSITICYKNYYLPDYFCLEFKLFKDNTY